MGEGFISLILFFWGYLLKYGKDHRGMVFFFACMKPNQKIIRSIANNNSSITIIYVSETNELLMTTLRLELNEKLYLKNPQDTELGKKIIKHAIQMIDQIGLEAFTFKKLSQEIDSTEASIYRYFENKHKLLVYLLAWYWNWLEYRIEYETNNVSSPNEKLKIAIHFICKKQAYDPSFPAVDEVALQRIVINESEKTYLTKQVDSDNKDGLFWGYKSLCHKIACMVKIVNPNYPYAHALMSTCLQAAHQQVFFSEHLPSLTEHGGKEDQVFEQNSLFLMDMITKTLQN